MVAAVHSYFLKHPKGVAPGQGFIMDFIAPFLEMELVDKELAVREEIRAGHSRKERDLLERRAVLNQECEKRMKHEEKR